VVHVRREEEEEEATVSFFSHNTVMHTLTRWDGCAVWYR